MRIVSRALIVSLAALPLFSPALALAFPFGGQASQVVPCYNQAIYANLGPPRGGPFIWTPSTRTYQFGPPTHAGQWLLGLAGAPYFCVVSIQPVIVWPGTYITMMGSSQSGGIAGLLGARTPTTATPNPIPNQGGGTGSGSGGGSQPLAANVVITEVFYAVDSSHGTDPQNEWIELYNGTSATIDLSGWMIQNGSNSSPLPSGTTIASGQFLLISPSLATYDMWPVPTGAKKVSIASAIAGGLGNPGAVVLKNSVGVVDAVSWGGSTAAFSPSATQVSAGSSLARTSLTQDTNTANDWVARSAPTPGK